MLRPRRRNETRETLAFPPPRHPSRTVAGANIALNRQGAMLNSVRMSTLAEIEAAADALPSQQQEELFLYLAVRLRARAGQLPSPREFSREQIQAWIADDEAGMRRFREGR